MRLYIQEKSSLIKYNLPAKVDGSMLYYFKSTINGMENSINIDAVDGKWVLKSNGNVNILGSGNSIIPEVVLSDYMCIPISVTGLTNYLCIFCLPSIEEYQYAYEVGNLTNITIGKGSNNNIIYQQNMMADEHAVIKYENNSWFIYPTTTDLNVCIYVNSQRVFKATPIFAGDIIFMNGLRIIWMKKSFIIPMANHLYKVSGIQPIGIDNNSDNTKYNPVSEVDSNINLYNENEYFSHTPRIRSILEPEVIDIDAPPGKQDNDNELPFLLSIGSSFTMLGMMFLNMFNIFNGLSSGEKDVINFLPQIIMVITMIIGALLIPQITKKYQKKLAKKKEQERQTKYSEYLGKKEKEIDAIKKKQEEIVIENNIDLNGCIQNIQKRGMLLWNRTNKDDDFLTVRVGVGDRPSMIEVNAPKEQFTLDDDNLYQAVVALGQKYDKLNNVPITVNLKEQIVTSLIMQNKQQNEFINGLLLQILTLHSPLDLKVVILTDQANSYRWNYLRYTNHNWSDDHQTRFFSTSQDDLKTLCQFLDTEYNDRRDRKVLREKEAGETSKEKLEDFQLYDSYYLVITDTFKSIRKHKFIQDMLENQYNYGFSMLIIDKDMKNIPNECKKFLVINDSESGMFNQEVSEEATIKFKAEYANGLNMHQLAKLVGNIPIQGKDAESQLPSALSFLQMYNVGKIEQLNIRNRWATSDPMSTLAAPIGVHTSGEIFNLDLHEKFDGPHGLIAGSTGSGKSEFIITYILSMALNYDPKEVQFVLIDYKGGGLAGAFENREMGISIPHLAGTITNLDTAEMNRTLVSIESELKRRQRQFNKVKEQTGESTMDIYKYQRLYREGLIDEPISHLFIISDEFAELKAQQPEFMAQLVSTARIGRSLGVHLILATQKPTGVVNDQIWSNSKFKVCLKVQTKSDSMEMLKRPEAASLKEAGRFYLQVGYDEYFDIGQSGWTGEKYVPTERIVKKIDDSICFVDHFGNVIKRSVDPTKKVEVKEDIGDQLTNIVKYLDKIAQEDGLKVNKLWLPSLDKNIKLEDLLNKYPKENSEEMTIKAVIGEYDAPANQEQGLLSIDLLNDGNVLIYGAPGSGKENLISTMVYYLSTIKTPEEVNIYIGDFGAETLKIMNKIPHVGDTFVTDEAQKLENMIKMLNKELDRRKKDYSEFGGNYKEYCKLSGNLDPFIIVALNNYENFIENYPKMSDVFSSLFREGAKYGMVFVVSTTQQNAVRARVAQNFVNKICMKMPNDTDYRDLLGTPRGMVPVDNFGRGIISVDGDNKYEFQTADFCDREQKTQFIREYGKKLKEQYKGIKVKKIPVLPDIAYVEDVEHELKDLTCVPIGIEKNSLEVYVYNFLEQKINLIAAKSIKNHIYFVYALLKQILSLKGVKVHVIDALSIYRGNYEGIDLYTDNLENAFVTAYKNVGNDKEMNEKHVYFILGVSEFRNKVAAKYGKNFEALFTQVSKCENNTFLFFDDSDDYKLIQVENWFRDNINNTFGIWLGEDIGVQVALGVMSLSIEDKNNIFPCIGYPIYQGNHMVVKYVVDGVDKKDE